MDRRRLVVTPAAAALLLVTGPAWAGPPPPPPPSADGGGDGGGESVRNSAPPPPASTDRLEPAPADPLVIDQRTPETNISSNWSYSRGGEQGPNYVREAEDDPFQSVNPIGYYQGVSVSGGNLPPYAPKEIGGQSAVLTWTGFERAEASSRVFFQLSASVEPDITVESGRVFVKFPRTSVTARNNRRPLITKFFNTPVTEVKISKAGKDVVAVLELRWASTPEWHFETGANGYRVLVLEFADVQDQSAPSNANADSTVPPPPPAPPPGPFLPAK